ncbi:hypothetical protein L1280_001172 [Deinococcus sp. HSC-46F16]|uniref:site-specific integrase n=1 Tax=Deinococcus sp. HSC-46F16 TaxID=2910968 RepID=UPI0020A1A7F9|nr:site-specific integrase [Deinococcus sp. HSC-46F16]MCP2014035.1 hypothetical protein [Deinococcus sp. HSC-46F16]
MTDMIWADRSYDEIISDTVRIMHMRELSPATVYTYQSAVSFLLNWMSQLPGEDWQQRWLNVEEMMRLSSGAMPFLYKSRRGEFMAGLLLLFSIRLIRPTYSFINKNQFGRIHIMMGKSSDKIDFDRLKHAAKENDFNGSMAMNALLCASFILIHTGKRMDQITLEDIDEYRRNFRDGIHSRVTPNGLHTLLRHLRIIESSVMTTGSQRMRGPSNLDQIMLEYAMPENRTTQAFRAYLNERQSNILPMLLRREATHLVEDFWLNILQHHPEQKDFNISWQVAQDWKSRIRDKDRLNDPVSVKLVFQVVRRFYKFLEDLAEGWPSEWGDIAAHSPVNQTDISMESRRKSETKQKLDRHVLSLLPHLKAFRLAIKDNHEQSSRLLEVGLSTPMGGEFTLDGVVYKRLLQHRKQKTIFEIGASPLAISTVKEGCQQIIYPHAKEERAFWVWACMEVLLGTGLRPHELFRLLVTDLDFRTGADGQIIPCLRIAAGKTIYPRVIDISPEVSSVLATIIRRVQGEKSEFPLVDRYEYAYRAYKTDIPLIMQKRLTLIELGSLDQKCKNG